MKYFSHLLLFLLILFFSFSCKSNKNRSLTQEAWDDANTPAVFDVEPLYYHELATKDYLSGSLREQPWSDDYWPLDNAGAGSRWIDDTKAPSFFFKTDIMLSKDLYASHISQEIEAIIQETSARTSSGKWEDSVYLSPAEKYDLGIGDLGFSLTKKELNSFANNLRKYELAGVSWSWMGHCHGWAPISYLYEKPKHAVLIKNRKTGNEVLYTEGDIRALLTKTAADNSFIPKQLFLGTRCNDENVNILKDHHGRMLDGAFVAWDESIEKLEEKKPIKIFVNNWTSHSELDSNAVELVFGFAPPFQKADKYWLRSNGSFPFPPGHPAEQQRVVDVEIFSTIRRETGEYSKNILLSSSTRPQDIGCKVNEYSYCLSPPNDELKKEAAAIWKTMWFDLRDEDRPSPTKPLAFKYYKACRDLNAGAFHTVLARLVSKAALLKGESHGFVLDVTRSGEVWNHPIFAFESKVGAKTPLDGLSISDPFRTFRSPDAISVVDVYTVVIYAVENGPFVTYQSINDHLSSRVFHYTLELDKDDKVVGGEWHSLPTVSDFEKLYPLSGEELFKQLRRLAKNRDFHREFINGNTVIVHHKPQDAPDFMWLYVKGSKLAEPSIKKSVINNSFIETLYQCSVNGSKENTLTINSGINQHKISYRRCDYTP